MPRHLPNLFGEAPQIEGFAILIGDEEGRPPSSAPSEVLLSTLCRNRAAKACSVLLGLCLVTIICVLLGLETMGQTVTTPLSLTLSHWRDVQDYAHNQSVDVHKRKWITLCSSEWPTFDVGWPWDGTFNPQTIFQVKEKTMDPGPQGHPDQVD
ncbi:Gag polyprotein [Cricetulus griseus]|uniref:Gag polyprotein n=1 Tax=Cricetulus griseus TaxID=10029 RepID=G3H357_CRIGR|nr:Gag polyprotein [Cricetulus griseus]